MLYSIIFRDTDTYMRLQWNSSLAYDRTTATRPVAALTLLLYCVDAVTSLARRQRRVVIARVAALVGRRPRRRLVGVERRVVAIVCLGTAAGVQR